MSYSGHLSAGNGTSDGRWLKRLIVLAALALPVVVAVLVTASKPSLAPSTDALATLRLPFGGAKVIDVAATVGREQKDLPVRLIGDQVWPSVQVATGQTVTVLATVKRPGWNAWLAGGRQQVKVSVRTPSAKLASAYVTVKSGHDMALRFSQPVTIFGSGTLGGAIKSRALARAQNTIALRPTATAGTISVVAAPRAWEIPARQAVSWFPAGTAATAVADPSPGTTVDPQSKITLTFSKPVTKALSGTMPGVSPAGSGTWKTLNDHTIQFQPSGYGYGLGTKVQVALPAGVHLIGGTGDPVGTWQVPTGSTLRLQQMLAMLGYLPVSFSASGTPVPDTMSAQESAAVKAPTGSFSWRYSDTPSELKSQWQPGSYDEVTKAAVMSFESTAGLDPDGVDGPQVWKALIEALIQHRTSSFGYTFVLVHEASAGENEATWHNGRTVVSGAVNTGVAGAGGTAPGVFAVFEHTPSTTMTGVNPDGSHYSDPDIPDVSYFNGGDALHGFIRASYGFPQSDGCVEMPYAEASAVYPYTPVGTVVDVSTS